MRNCVRKTWWEFRGGCFVSLIAQCRRAAGAVWGSRDGLEGPDSGARAGRRAYRPMTRPGTDAAVMGDARQRDALAAVSAVTRMASSVVRICSRMSRWCGIVSRM